MRRRAGRHTFCPPHSDNSGGCHTRVRMFENEAATRNRTPLRAHVAPGPPWAGDHRGNDRCAHPARLLCQRQDIQGSVGCPALGDRTRKGLSDWARPVQVGGYPALHRVPNPPAGAGFACISDVVAMRWAKRLTLRSDSPCPIRSAGVWDATGRLRVCVATAPDTHADNGFRWRTPVPKPL